MNIVDLDEVLISAPAYKAWMDIANSLPAKLEEMTGRLPNIEDIPDEQGNILPDGSLEIFVDIPGYSRIGMIIPPNHWKWKSNQ